MVDNNLNYRFIVHNYWANNDNIPHFEGLWDPNARKENGE